jgi:tmRNA-binding protein
MFSLDQKIKALQREKDSINRDADDRVKLGLKKDALESSKEKLKEMHVSFLSLSFFLHYVPASYSLPFTIFVGPTYNEAK